MKHTVPSSTGIKASRLRKPQVVAGNVAPIQPSLAGWMNFFAPDLSGATLLDRLVACGGALIGIGLTGILCSLIEFHHVDINAPLLVAPAGASAVLLFALPASPLAQPWPIIGGNVISTCVGIAVGRIIHDPTIAAALAVALATGVMSLARCLHPPGGAAALAAVLGGPAMTSAGFMFAFVPMGLNCFMLVGLGWLFHKLSRHSYPHRSGQIAVNTHGTRDLPAPVRVGFQAEDISGALADFGETYDIGSDDLDHLLRRIEMRAFARTHNNLVCADIMSRDVIHIDQNATSQTARSLLLNHDVRTLPVVDERRKLIGIIGLRELSRQGEIVSDLMAEAEVTLPDQPAFNLVAPLTDGRNHAVVVVDRQRHLLGIVTQTDLLAALALASMTGQNAPA